MIYIVVFLCMVNIGVQVEICAHKVILMVNNSRKPVIFCDVLYHLNVIFLQRIFEGLNNVFSYSKTTRTKCAKAHYVSETQIKELGESFLMV
jgi:hypothetical protein